MSNRFKSNSRFANLMEETKNISVSNKGKNERRCDNERRGDNEKMVNERRVNDKKDNNERTVENNKFSTKEKSFMREESNGFKQRRNDRYGSRDKDNNKDQFQKMMLEQEKKKKEAEAQKQLSSDNFPDLLSNSNININTNNNTNVEHKPEISYVDKTKQIKNDKPIDNNFVKPGWVEVKRDPSNPRKLIYTYGESTYKEESERKKNKSEQDVLTALVNLHNRQKQDYINMWGYENWEHLYRFPNYDYHYFDKLDEKYEEEEILRVEDE